MNYINIDKFDTANSHGISTVLWVCGCSHHCPQCHNQPTWNPNAGREFDISAEEELFAAASNLHTNAVVLSGGDPLFAGNILSILNLCKKFKALLPSKTLILYTGFKADNLLKDFSNEGIIRKNILKNINFLIDGRFEIEQRVKGIDLRGSLNQQCYEVIKEDEKFFLQNKSYSYFKETTQNDFENFEKKFLIEGVE